MSIRSHLGLDAHYHAWLQESYPRRILLVEGMPGIGKTTLVAQILAEQCVELVQLDGDSDCDVDASGLPVIALSTETSRRQFAHMATTKPRDGSVVVLIDDADQLLRLQHHDYVMQLRQCGPPLILVSSDNYQSKTLRSIEGSKYVKRVRLWPPPTYAVEKLLLEQQDVPAQPRTARRIAMETGGDVRRALLQYRLEARVPIQSLVDQPVYRVMREGDQVFNKLKSLLGSQRSALIPGSFAETLRVCGTGGGSDQSSLLRLYRGYYLQSMPNDMRLAKAMCDAQSLANQLEGDGGYNLRMPLAIGCIGPARILDIVRAKRKWRTPVITIKGNGLDGPGAKREQVGITQKTLITQAAFRGKLMERGGQFTTLTKIEAAKGPKAGADQCLDDYGAIEKRIAKEMPDGSANRLISQQHDRLFYQTRILARTSQKRGFPEVDEKQCFSMFTVAKPLLVHMSLPEIAHHSRSMSNQLMRN